MKEDTRNNSGLTPSGGAPIGKRLELGSTQPPVDAYKAEVEGVLLEVDQEFDAAEQAQAQSIVDAVLPRFVERRAAQSADRVTQHVRSMARGVVADLAPQFRSMQEGNQAAFNGMADDLLNSFFAA
jgi:hypothetical protein